MNYSVILLFCKNAERSNHDLTPDSLRESNKKFHIVGNLYLYRNTLKDISASGTIIIFS